MALWLPFQETSSGLFPSWGLSSLGRGVGSDRERERERFFVPHWDSRNVWVCVLLFIPAETGALEDTKKELVFGPEIFFDRKSCVALEGVSEFIYYSEIVGGKRSPPHICLYTPFTFS